VKRVLSAVIFSVALCVFEGGCAVLTVDVDVYKGPLANHPDVQTQQTAMLALAARPILGKLRYLLEKYERRRYEILPYIRVPFLTLGSPLKDLEHSDEYFDPYSPNRNRMYQGFQFISAKAEFVNKILAQYNDRAEAAALRTKVEKLNNGDATPAATNSASTPAAIYTQMTIAEARARPGKGLEALTSDYLEELAKPNGKAKREHLPSEFPQLYDALILFADRVLYVANNEALFEENSGLYFDLKDFGKDILIGGSDVAAANKSYVRVLQSVGSSIIVNLNELKERETFDERSLAAVPQEKAGLDLGAHRLPFQVLQDAIGFLADRQLKLTEPAEKAKRDKDAADKAVTDATKLQETAQIALDKAKTESDAANADTGDPQKQALKFVNLMNVLDKDQEFREEWSTYLLDEKGGNPQRVSALEVVEKLSLTIRGLTKPPKQGNEDWRKRRGEAVELIDDVLKNGDHLASVHDGKRIEVYASLRTTLGAMGAEATAKSTLDRSEKTKALAAAKTGLEDAANKLKTAKDGAEKAGTASKQADANLKAARDAHDQLGKRGPELLAELSRAGENPEPAATLAKIRADLIKAKDANGITPEEKQKIQNAIDALATYEPLPSAPATAFVAKSVRDVMDGVISTLRQEHISAVERSGVESDAAKRAEAALEAAYAHRADMIYIRPASAYLRTSFPAASLQRDARLGWKNMLAEQEFRQIPFADLFQDQQYYHTLQELDKQYWQNVNTIRVAGGGDTNYAVVKDDVGNWYVKNYSADPKDIINSAKNLALFGLGPAIGGGLDLINQAAKTGQDASLAPATRPTTLQQQFDGEQSKYDKATRADTRDALDAAKHLSKDVQDAWDKETLLKGNTKLADALKAQQEALLDKLPSSDLYKDPDPKADPKTAPKPTTRPADQVIDTMQAMRRFHNAVAAAVPTAVGVVPGDNEKALADAKTTKQKADDDAKAAASKLDDATKARDAAKADQTAKENDLTAARTRQDAAAKNWNGAPPEPAELTAAKQQVAAASDAKTIADNAVNAKQSVFDTATADDKKAKDAVTAAQKKVDDAQKNVDADNAAKAAKRILADNVRTPINKFLSRRKSTVERFDTAVQIIGASAGVAQ
jgi:hypothetical protein